MADSSNQDGKCVERKSSATTQTFTNHQGMSELKQAKNEWISRLEDNSADFQDIFNAQDSLFSRLSLTTFVDSAMAILKNDQNAIHGPAAPRSPPPRPLIKTSTGEVVVRRRPHSIEPMPAHRFQTFAAQTSPSNTSCLGGSTGFGAGGPPSPMMTQLAKCSALLPRAQQDLMVVTGKVDYRKLKEEQKALNAKTAAADVDYREMMNRFDKFNAEVERKFSLMLQDTHHIIPPIPEAHQAKHLVTVPDNAFKKMEVAVAESRAADAF